MLCGVPEHGTDGCRRRTTTDGDERWHGGTTRCRHGDVTTQRCDDVVTRMTTTQRRQV